MDNTEVLGESGDLALGFPVITNRSSLLTTNVISISVEGDWMTSNCGYSVDYLMQVDSNLDVKCECVFVCAHALMLECMCACMCL